VLLGAFTNGCLRRWIIKPPTFVVVPVGGKKRGVALPVPYASFGNDEGSDPAEVNRGVLIRGTDRLAACANPSPSNIRVIVDRIALEYTTELGVP
jgi:hypothetical protein